MTAPADRPRIHHLDIAVADLARSERFYTQALAPLGLRLLDRHANPRGGVTLGYGVPPDPLLWLRSDAPTSLRVHVAFVAGDRAQVDAFHRAAVAAGGIDHGPPGDRPRYGDGYYAAFVLDPDGHNIEAVWRRDGGGDGDPAGATGRTGPGIRV
ncbi:VOC family protein [Luteimonas viscosa]|uniref:VOC family protein n=1 Tax=Luteimonas viscosa TaxID=1132694 RepID=A0A5D4XPF0_9GAMM|nr:VOC family protein [Luteimonas viscosa]TYT26536.1 VOC family protein [Luteimonas viscosa]